MKIALLPEYFFPHVGGIETWTYEVARELSRRGQEVSVFTYKAHGHRDSKSTDGFRIVRTGLFILDSSHSYMRRALSLSTGLPKLLLRERFDRYLASPSLLLLCRSLRRRPLFSVWHGYYGLNYAVALRGLMKGFERTVIEQAALQSDVNGVIAVARHLKDLLLWMNPRLDEQKVHVVHGGVNLGVIDSLPKSHRRRTICFIGRMDQGKHPDHVLQAYVKLAREFPELRLVFSGTGPYVNVLRRMVSVAPKEISDRISITYLWNKERFKLLKESLLLVYPSVMEAFPLTTLEALACETPFLGYDIPALKEQVHETGGGILVQKNNVEELAEVLRRLLSNGSKILDLARKGRKAVEYKFTWEKTVDSLLKAIG